MSSPLAVCTTQQRFRQAAVEEKNHKRKDSRAAIVLKKGISPAHFHRLRSFWSTLIYSKLELRRLNGRCLTARGRAGSDGFTRKGSNPVRCACAGHREQPNRRG